MSGEERLGRPFRFDLDLLSEDAEIDFTQVVGKNMTVRHELLSGETRHFNGYVSRFAQVGRLGRMARYQATLVPWLWFLTRTSDCQIFQEMTVPDIIEKVFSDLHFTDFKRRLDASYRTWNYCTQYRETAFNFVSRLMEQEGIYYYFSHEDGKHTLVLADGATSHDPFPGYDTIRYHHPGQAVIDFDYILAWQLEQRVQSGQYAMNDFDFTAPKKSLQVRSQIRRSHGGAGMEIYDYPGDYTAYDNGEQYSRVRIEELQSQHEVVRGEGNAGGVAPGCTFTLSEHPRQDQCRKYLVTGAHYHLEADEYDSDGAPTGRGPAYTCSFDAISADEAFRAARATTKPLIQGPQTAIVTGPGGEEIHTDEYGRVKVQFHWDRHGKADDNSSCWIRVSQGWAGKKWGAIYLPRIGQEVIVEFLEGDPDRPIITGRVYNGGLMPPYDLPGNKTLSTLKSNSSKGGGGFNEIRFEDKKGEEQIFVHAESNQDIRVKNDTKEWIGRDRHMIVKRDQFEKVEGDKHLAVMGDQNEKIDGTVSVDAGGDMQQKVGLNHALDAGMEIHLKAGMKVVVEGGIQISLKVGGNFVDISPMGVTITGTMVNINSGGSAGSGSGSSPEAPTDPLEAADADPGAVAEPTTAKTPPTPTAYSAQAKVLKQAAAAGTPFCERCEAARQARSQQQQG